MARGSAAARPDRDVGRRDGGDLLGISYRGGTASTFRAALKEVFGEHGLPMSLYTDRGALPVPVADSTGIVILLTSAVMPFTYTTWNRYRIHFGRLPTDAP